MEMKRINAGKLRAIGYDPAQRILRVELDDGSVIEHSGVGEAVWQRLSGSGSAWSYYRDVIEEEFRARRVSRDGAGEGDSPKANPLDRLFGD